ncbi:hypothetical protein Hamer_G007576 [Homarus americanus]|uniref:Helitron helicase-like domain-containing protein n=1 Tax=Homarus americanus TaxID=6706 RepID=A0A8J5MRM2_HOMAM|nr:hypothetical protein Hamer_G007576 [Homarus americanus]
MPRKRKSSYANTPHAQRMRLRRQSESCDAREERLSRQRQRQTESRQNEYLGEHQERQEQDRFRHVVARRNESEEERQQRLIADRNRCICPRLESICKNPRSLMPPEDRRARYIQVYFLDTLEDQLRARGEHQNLNADILERITAWLNENNHYVRELKTALEEVRQGNINDKKIVIWENKRAQGEHARRFNAPTGAEVAILMSNEPTENRDIVLQLKQGGLRRISELHRSYDPLMYPLFFPYGTDGYHIYLQGRNGRKVTQLQFYSFHIMCREGNYLLLGRRLFQQFLVDDTAK